MRLRLCGREGRMGVARPVYKVLRILVIGTSDIFYYSAINPVLCLLLLISVEIN